MKIMRLTFLALSVAVMISSCKTVVTTIPVPVGSTEAIVATKKSLL